MNLSPGLSTTVSERFQSMQPRRDVSMNTGRTINLFKYTKECQRAFQSLVDKFTSEFLVQLWSLDKEVTLTTVASEKIGAVLPRGKNPVSDKKRT